jgi:hypothetical protein
VLSIGVVVLAALMGFLAVRASGLSDGIPFGADSIADWLVTRAFVEGVDPYLPVPELGQMLGVPWESPNAGSNPAHPRLPGAFLLQLPMLLSNEEVASWGVILLGALGIVASLLMVARRQPVSAIAAVGFLAMAFLSQAAIWGFTFVSQALLLVGLMGLVAWQPSSPRFAVLRGLAIGIAGTLRIFPMLLIIPYIRRRDWKTVGWALGSFGVVNVLPLLAQHVVLENALSAFRSSLGTWFEVYSNISLLAWIDRGIGLPEAAILPVQVLIIALGVLVCLKVKPGLERELGALAVLGVAGFAISWPQYLLMALPFLLLVITRADTPAVARALGIASLVPFLILPLGPVWSAAIIGLFACCVYVGSERSPARPAAASALGEGAV